MIYNNLIRHGRKLYHNLFYYITYQHLWASTFQLWSVTFYTSPEGF